jgi:hypothetical protein
MTYSPHYLPSYRDFAVNAGETRQVHAFDHCA